MGQLLVDIVILRVRDTLAASQSLHCEREVQGVIKGRRKVLTEDLMGLSAEYQARLARVIDTSALLSTLPEPHASDATVSRAAHALREVLEKDAIPILPLGLSELDSRYYFLRSVCVFMIIKSVLFCSHRLVTCGESVRANIPEMTRLLLFDPKVCAVTALPLCIGCCSELHYCFCLVHWCLQREMQLMDVWLSRMKASLLRANEMEHTAKQLSSHEYVTRAVDGVARAVDQQLASALQRTEESLRKLWDVALSLASVGEGGPPQPLRLDDIITLTELRCSLQSALRLEREKVETYLRANPDALESDVQSALAQLDASGTQLAADTDAKLQALGRSFVLEWTSSASQVCLPNLLADHIVGPHVFCVQTILSRADSVLRDLMGPVREGFAIDDAISSVVKLVDVLRTSIQELVPLFQISSEVCIYVPDAVLCCQSPAFRRL